ncbi:hypothetical protein HZS_7906 [Henneguya salminicola]|nr:hypothetical protein HZS_7906 [Henneguya salminicola]
MNNSSRPRDFQNPITEFSNNLEMSSRFGPFIHYDSFHQNSYHNSIMELNGRTVKHFEVLINQLKHSIDSVNSEVYNILISQELIKMVLDSISSLYKLKADAQSESFKERYFEVKNGVHEASKEIKSKTSYITNNISYAENKKTFIDGVFDQIQKECCENIKKLDILKQRLNS